MFFIHSFHGCMQHVSKIFLVVDVSSCVSTYLAESIYRLDPNVFDARSSVEAIAMATKVRSQKPLRRKRSYQRPSQSSTNHHQREILSSKYSRIRMSSRAFDYTARRLLLSCLTLIVPSGINSSFKQVSINLSSDMLSSPSAHSIDQ